MNRDRAVRVLCLTLVCCTAASFAGKVLTDPKSVPSADAKQQVLDLSKEWVAAEIKHDANTLNIDELVERRQLREYAGRVIPKQCSSVLTGEICNRIDRILGYALEENGGWKTSFAAITREEFE